MEIKKLVFNNFAVNTFVLYDDTKECVIVDPGCLNTRENNILYDFIQSASLKPVLVINTHCHLDHVAGNKFIKETFNIPIYAHKDELSNLEQADAIGSSYGMPICTPPNVDKFIDESEDIKFGHSTLKILHVPGHSLGSIALFSEEDKFVIAGDVLFNGSIGRTDLNGGSLDELLDSIKNKLFTLKDEVTVYPGHGPSTTIGKELRSNPFLLDHIM